MWVQKMLTCWSVIVQCRDIYHCPSCNLCRVGKGLGIDFFHCMTCNSCMAMQLKEHKCMEKGLESNCPICNDFLFTSNTPVKELPCGHFMHSACFKVCILLGFKWLQKPTAVRCIASRFVMNHLIQMVCFGASYFGFHIYPTVKKQCDLLLSVSGVYHHTL